MRFAQFGVPRSERGRVAEDKLRLLLDLRAGATVSPDGRVITVTPAPYTEGGPVIRWGGGSVAAAQRAGRYGLGLQANADVPGMREAYDAACAADGHEPAPVHLPDPGQPSTVFVADDVDRAWDELGPYLLHDARQYSAWNPGDDTTTYITHVETVDELRSAARGYRIVDPAGARALTAAVGPLRLAPLCGGLPPDVAWPYLERAAEVLAAVSRSASPGSNPELRPAGA